MEAVRGGIDRTRERPLLLVGGVLTVAAEAVVAVVVGSAVAGPIERAAIRAAGGAVDAFVVRSLVGSLAPLVGVTVAVLLALALVRALALPQLYALARGPEGTTIRPLVTGAKRTPRAVAAATLARVTSLLAVPFVLVAVVAPLLVLLTAGQYAWYAVDPTARWFPLPGFVVVGLFAVVLAGLAVARFPVSFAGVAGLDGTGPRQAGAASVRSVRRAPRRIARYGFVRVALAAVVLGAVAATVLVTVADPGGASTALVAGLVVGGGAARALGASVHVAVHDDLGAAARADGGSADEESDDEATGGPGPEIGRRRLAVLVAVGLTTALALGSAAAAVRVADERPWSPPPASHIDEDASSGALLENAREQVHARSVTMTARFGHRNEATGAAETDEILRHRVDRQSHRVRTDIRNGGSRIPKERLYVTAGAWAGRGGGDWFGVPVPAYPVLHRGIATDPWLPGHDGADWAVTERTDERTVVAVTGQDVRRVEQVGVARGGELTDNSYVRVTLDTRTGLVRRVEKDVGAVGSSHRRDTAEVTYSYGTVVSRPDDLGGPGAVELFWDAVYY